MAEERKIIKEYFEGLVKNNPEICNKNNLIDKVDIPYEMLDEERKNYWKLVEMQVEDNNIDKIETDFNIKLPDIFKAFISTYCHVFERLSGKFDNYFGDSDVNVCVDISPQLTSEPLEEIRNVLEQFDELVAMGYIPFGDLNGIGPLCIDMNANFNVVWFDHELYYRCKTREEYEELEVIIFDDFYQFLDCFFAGKKHTISN